MNEELLFTYTEFFEDHVQDILHIDPAEQASEGVGRDSQFLCDEFLTLPDRCDAAPECGAGLLQQFALPLAPDQAALAGAEIVLRERDQGRHEFAYACALARRNPEIGFRLVPRAR